MTRWGTVCPVPRLRRACGKGRRFNACYHDYVYLPLYAFVGHLPFWAQLRTADHGVARGAVEALEQIVAALRRRCKNARLIVRGDQVAARRPFR